jgi:hypothetical protein
MRLSAAAVVHPALVPMLTLCPQQQAVVWMAPWDGKLLLDGTLGQSAVFLAVPPQFAMVNQDYAALCLQSSTISTALSVIICGQPVLDFWSRGR